MGLRWLGYLKHARDTTLDLSGGNFFLAYYTIPCMAAQLLSNSSCSTEWVCLPSSSLVYNIEKVEDERGLNKSAIKEQTKLTEQ